MASDNPVDTSNGAYPNSSLENDGLSRKFERVNRAYRTLSACTHVLLHAVDEQALLRETCEAIVEKGGYRSAVVGHVERDEAKPACWKGNLQGKTFAALSELAGRYTWNDSEFGQTTIGTAIRTGQPCIGRHIFTDPAYAGHAFDKMRADATQYGFASVSAFPLRVHGEVIGALSMAAAEPDAFDEEEVKLLGELADDLAYGIANLRTRVQHREAQATIARLAFYDSLTGLPNRSLLLERLKHAIEASAQQQRALALLHLDVRGFQEINKVLGFRSADQMLQQLGQRIAGVAAESELLARVGEAGFALLLPHGGERDAIQVAQRLVALLGEPVDVSGVMLDPRPCVGIALYPAHATEAEMLLQRAHAAMLETRSGGCTFALYRSGQEHEFARRISLMSDLRRAIEHNELQLYCQPKVAIASRAVCGAEALVRWRHPVHGMLSTTEFITLAEQSGQITPLTHWVLNAVFAQSHAWHQAGLDLPLSVNLSARDLHDTGLIDRLRGLFSTWDIAPELIQFELTESALMEDPASALDTLTHLKQMGVELYIDDYGTGYSSLSYLQKLPVDWIKIDQAFVMPMAANSKSAAIVHSTIELGHNLNMGIVAEGVQSPAVWDSLAGLGCDVAQGYLISMPMPTVQFRNWENGWSQMHGSRSA